MADPDTTGSQVAYARFAGLMYLLDNLAYLAGLLILGRFVVPGDFTATADRIMDAELLYRVGLLCILSGGLLTVFLAIGLYVTVKPVDPHLAMMALAFRVAEATLFGALAILGFITLQVYLSSSGANGSAVGQLAALLNVLAAGHSATFNVAGLFFAVGSTLFFYLLFKANYIPRALSVFGLAASVLFAAVCKGTLLWPEHARLLQLGWLPMGLAEFVVGFWLLFKGLNLRPRGA